VNRLNFTGRQAEIGAPKVGKT